MSTAIRQQLTSATTLLVAALASLTAIPAAASTLQATADTYLQSGSANQNQGAGAVVQVQSTGKNRVLVAFDQATLVAAVGSNTVTAARLELFVESAASWGTSGRMVDVHRLSAAWSEGGATWNCASDSVPTNSSPDCATQWAGGSFATTPTSSKLHTNGMQGWVGFDVTADVTAFLTGAANHGWLVKLASEGASGSAVYTSREGTTGQAPRLVVELEAAGDSEAPVVAVTSPGAVVADDPRPVIAVTYSDAGSGVDLPSLAIRLDSAPLAGCTVTASEASCRPATLTAGWHTVTAEVRDVAGNLGSATLSFELVLGHATTVVGLPAVADTWLRSGSPNQSQGADPTLTVRSSGNNRALVAFDPVAMQATLDHGALVEARLELYVESNANNWGAGREVDAHALLAPWTESGATWNCPEDSDPSDSSPDCATEWDGGSFAATPTATVMHINGLVGWVSFDVTADLDAFAAGGESYGWVVKKRAEGADGHVDFGAREGVCDHSPRLVLTMQPAMADTTSPTAELVAPARPYIVNTPSPQLVVEYSDLGSGVDASTVELRLDGALLACDVCAWRATCTPPALAEGDHLLAVTLADQRGNTGTVGFTVEVLLTDSVRRATLPVAADTFLRQGAPNQAEGAETFLRVRASGPNRALVAFDEPELRLVTAGAPVRAALLETYVERNADNWGKDGRTVDLHRLLAPWTEVGATWNCADDADSTDSQPGCDPEWDGGSYSTTPSATTLVRKRQLGWLQLDVTDDVNAALAGAAFHGWLLRKTDEGAAGLVELTSKEGTSGQATRLVLVLGDGTPGDDTDPPAVTLDLPAASCLGSGVASFSGSYTDLHPASSGSAVSLAITRTDGTTATVAAALAGSSWLAADVALGGVDGTATVVVTAVDAFGNPSPLSRSYRVDLSAPAVALLMDGLAFPGSAPGTTPLPGTAPTVVGRAFSAAAVASDPPFPEPLAASLALDGAAFPNGGTVASEGVHLLVATALDCGGHAAAAHVLVQLDLTAPVVTVYESGQAVTGELTLGRPAVFTAQASDATATELEATVDGAPYLLGAPFGTSGEHLLVVRATDEAGHVGEATLRFTVDLTPPELTVTAPAPGEVVDGTSVTVSGQCSADVTTVTVEGVAAVLGAESGGWRPFTAAEVPLLLEGTNELALVARDEVGLETQVTVTVERDTQPPVLTLTSPEDGLVTRLPELVVSGQAVDPNLATVTVDGQPVATGADGAFSHLLALVEGANVVVVTATDSRDHQAQATRTVTRDASAPEVTVTNGGQPLADGFLTNQPVTPVATVSDASAVTTVILLNGAPFVSGTTVSAEGVYLLVVSATDAAGNVTTLERGFTVDTTPPVVSGLTPAAGSFLATVSLTLSGVADDAVAVTVNGQPATLTAGVFTLAGLTLVEGDNALAIVARDAAGNERSLSHALVLDTTDPVLTLTAPGAGEVVGESEVTVAGTAADAHLERVTVNGRPASLAGTSFQVVVALTAEGETTLSVEARDRAGNVATLSRTVERDSQAPELTVSEPGPLAVLASGTFTVRGTATDAHLQTVTVNGQTVTTDAAGAFAKVLTLGEGRHTVTVEAVDARGHRTTVTREVTVDLEAPGVVVTAPRGGEVLDTTTVTVTGHVDDPAEVVTLTVNGLPVTVAPDGAFTTTVELAEGPGEVIVRARDAAGNDGVASVSVRVDTVPPAVLSTVPAAGATGVPTGVQLRVTFTEAVAAPTAASGITLTAAGEPLPVTVTTSGAVATVAANGGLRSDAEHQLTVGTAVTDLAGHQLAAAVTVAFHTVDATPPATPVVVPPPSPACFATLALAGTAEPGVRVEASGRVRAAATTADEVDGSFALELTPTVTDGAVAVSLSAVDTAGNRSSLLPVTVELDCRRPAVERSDWNGAQTVTLRLSEPVVPATVAPGTSLLLADSAGSLSFSFTLSGSTLELTLGETPDPALLPLRLELTEVVTDLAGNPAVPYTRLLSDPATATLVAGEVFDDATSLELPGATVTLVEDGDPLEPGAVVVTADGRGRFSLPVTGSPVTVEIAAEGYVPAWRRVVPVPGMETLLFDARLARRAEAQHLTTAAQLVGGDAELTVPATALPAGGVDFALTALGEQSLPDLLPLGWRPLAAVELLLDGELDAPATLRFTSTQSSGAVVARYDAELHGWVAESAVTTLDVTSSGIWALVAPDAEPTSPGPALVGATLPSATPVALTDPATELVGELALDPPVILPMETAEATVTATPAVTVPSGLAVEALLDEVLHVVDGRVLVAPPAATDLVLYRQPDDQLRAVFGLGASDSARQVALDRGTKTVQVRLLPSGVRTSDLVGPSGGTILTPSGLGLEVPPGALDHMAGVRLDTHSLDALPLVLPAGLEAVAAAMLELGDAVFGQAATLSYAATNVPPGQLLVLSPVELEGATRWRLIGDVALVDGRALCAPRAELPAPWVVQGGLYVLVRPTADAWSLVSGEVVDVDAQPAAGARVDASGGLVQLTSGDGRYATAAPAGPVDLLATQLVTRNLGATSVTTTPGEHRPGVAILLEVAAPRVVATSPEASATNVRATTPVTVDLSEPVVAGSDAITVRVVVGTGAAQAWAGTTTLSGDGTRLTWTPEQAYPPACQVLVTVAAAVADRQGYMLAGGAYAFSFSVERFLLPQDVDAAKIRLYMPGRDADSPESPVVEAADGAVPGDAWLWVEDLDHDADTQLLPANQSGSFTFRLPPFDGVFGVAVGDRLVLHLETAEGQELGLVPLRPWLTNDGLGAWLDRDGGAFETLEGVGVDVPFAAFPEGATLHVERVLDPSSLLTTQPTWAPPRAAFELEVSTRAADRITLRVPGDAPSDLAATLLVGRLLEVAGEVMPTLVATAHWLPECLCYETTRLDEAVLAGSVDLLATAAALGVPDYILPGVDRTGAYVLFEPILSEAEKAELRAHAREVELRLATDGVVLDGEVEIRKVFLAETFGVVIATCSPWEATLVAQSANVSDQWLAEANDVFGLAIDRVAAIHPNRDFVLRVVDADTGFTYSETGYSAPVGGFVDIKPSDAPGMAGEALEIVGGDPVTVVAARAVVGWQPVLQGVELKGEVAEQLVKMTLTVAAGALPSERRVVLQSLADGQRRETVASGDEEARVVLSVRPGSPLLVAVEGELTGGDQPVRLVFNKAMSGVTNGDVNVSSVMTRLETTGQVVAVYPPGAWRADSSFTVRVSPDLFTDARFGHGQSLAQSVELPVRVASVLSGRPVLPNAAVGDVDLEGDVLLVADREGGLKAFDVSDPAAPVLVGYSQGLTRPGAVRSDGFGQVLTVEGRSGDHIAVRSYSMAQLIAPPPPPPADEKGPVWPTASASLDPGTVAVAPGNLDLEVAAETLRFTVRQLDDRPPDFDPKGVRVVMSSEDPERWEKIEVPPSLLPAHHPYRLQDGLDGHILARGHALPGGGVEISNPGGISSDQPLLLATHQQTVAWAHADGGRVVGYEVEFTAGQATTLTQIGGGENRSFAEVLSSDYYKLQRCRSLGSADLAYLGRVAVTPRDREGKALLVAATRREGLLSLRLDPPYTFPLRPDGPEDEDTRPDMPVDWVADLRCLRTPTGTLLNDVASEQWPWSEGEPTPVVAVVGSRQLSVFEVEGGYLSGSPVTLALEWDPFRVALDPAHRLVLVRDNDRHLAIFQLDRTSPRAAAQLSLVAELELPNGFGLGTMALDPERGLLFAGTAPVQYRPPQVELLGDADRNGVLEQVEYLQPLGAPLPPADAAGNLPPHLGWVRARVVGVPSTSNTVKVVVEGLSSRGGALPQRPAPYLPTGAEVELERPADLALDDPGRSVFVSKRPILLVADERARSEHWQTVLGDSSLHTKLTADSDGPTVHAVVPLCRHCDRDNGTPADSSDDIPWGEPAPRPGSTAPQTAGTAPYELAAAGTLRFRLLASGSDRVWLTQAANADLLPTGTARSVAWGPSPPLGLDPVVGVSSPAAPEVELSAGSLELSKSDLTLTAPGLGLGVGRSYQSAGISYGLFGPGWQLSGLDLLRPNPDGTVDLYTSSGRRFVFSANGPGANGAKLTATGHPGELKQKHDKSFFLLAPDGSYTEYGVDGLPSHVRDRFRKDEKHGSELRYAWYADGTLAQVDQVNGTGSTESKPRTVRFSYEQGADGASRGVVATATDATSRTFVYGYDSFNRLTGAWINDVDVDSGGTTATVAEKYTPSLESPDVAKLEEVAALKEVKGADNQPSLTVAWTDGRVTGLTRGHGGDAVETRVDPAAPGATTWTVTEGVSAANRTVTTVAVSPAKAGGFTFETTVGSGADAMSSRTTFDGEGRVTDTRDAAGIHTHTAYRQGVDRRLSFQVKEVTTFKGTVGEERPETPPSLATVYEYHPGTSFVSTVDRPGPDGTRLVTSFGLDGDDYPSSVTGPDGVTTTRGYDRLGRVKTVTSSTGSTTVMEYDDDIQGTGELRSSTSTTAAGVAFTQLTRDARGFVTESYSTAPRQPPRTSTTQVNALGWSLQTRSGTSTSRTSYDADGRIARIESGGWVGEEFQGLSTTVPHYTSAGMIDGITRSQGGTIETSTMDYDDAGRLETSTTAGLTTTYGYDTAGRTRTRQEGNLPATVYGYEAGRLVSTTSPGGKTWTNVYDKLGRQVGRVDPAGLREDLTMKVDGQLAIRKLVDEETEAVWSQEDYAYYPDGKLWKHSVHRFELPPVAGAAEEVLTSTTLYYSADDGPKHGLVKSVEDPLGRVTSFDYDDAGREKLRTLPDGTEVETVYYADGKVKDRIVRFTDADPTRSWSLTTSTTYDDQGRVKTVTAPGGQVTRSFYDALGRKDWELTDDSVPDGSGGEVAVPRYTNFDYGELGRTVTTIRPDGAVITREHDERGNLTAYVDTDLNRTEYRYDSYGRLEKILYPDDLADDDPSRVFTYEVDGEVDTITRKDGSVVDFDYEPDTGRLDTITVTGGVQPGGMVDFDYDQVGHLTAASDLGVVLGFSWDSVGNQLSESMALPGVPGGFPTKQLTRRFDRGDRPALLGLPDGTPYVQRLYDSGDRLTGLLTRPGLPGQLGDPSGGSALWSATYAGSRMTSVTRGNGLATTFAYDDEGRPLDVRTGVPEADGTVTDPLHRLGLTWTEASLRRTKTREDLNRTVERFHYDEVGHLESSLEGVPAIVEASEDLAALTGLAAASLTEDWQVNTVDELTRRARVLEGRSEDPQRLHPNPLHQVEQVGTKHYAWDVNGNLETASTEGAPLPDATYTHDWRDRLVGVEQGDTTTRLVVDPLGRLVAKVTETGAGDTARVYLHDGDQVVAEYVQPAGGTSYQLDRRMHWGTWIDQLVATEVDADHNGSAETTLYPVTDLLGSVQLLTDSSGRIVERVEYDADGTPHFASGDAVAPVVTRVAWTGDGTRPTGDTVEASAFEVGLSEWLTEASVADATATLGVAGGDATSLTVSLDAGGRSVMLTGATLAAGESATLQLAGLRDRSGNAMPALELPLTVADAAVYETLADTTAPRLLAVMDAADGLYLAFDEPVVAPGGGNLATAVTVTRQGGVVAGTTSRVSANVVRWAATDSIAWLPTATYTLTAAQLVDTSLAANAADTNALPLNFAHLAETPGETLVAYEASGDSQPRGESTYGVTSLFQGRGWHQELGLYYYRARWYHPEAGVFAERDPLGNVDGSNPYHWLLSSPHNLVDASGGKTEVRFDKQAGEITVHGFIEFFGEDADRQIAAAVAASIEAGWTKQARSRDGRRISVKTTIHYDYSQGGETKRSQSWDQIRLFKGKDVGQMNLADRVTGAPEAERRDVIEGTYERSIAGGVSVGRINFRNVLGWGWLPALYPGEAAHEFGHLIGLWYHTGHDYFPTTPGADEIGEVSVSQRDPMVSCRIRPEHYILSVDEVEWLIEVAEKQMKENPAYVGEWFTPPPPPLD